MFKKEETNWHIFMHVLFVLVGHLNLLLLCLCRADQASSDPPQAFVSTCWWRSVHNMLHILWHVSEERVISVCNSNNTWQHGRSGRAHKGQTPCLWILFYWSFRSPWIPHDTKTHTTEKTSLQQCCITNSIVIHLLIDFIRWLKNVSYIHTTAIIWKDNSRNMVI